MLDGLFASFDGLLKEKHSLSAKRQLLARTEQRLIERLSRALAGSGYRVVPVASAARARQGTAAKPLRPKHLQCPKCERMFAHPLPMARHLKATHNVTVGSKKKAIRRSAQIQRREGTRP